jgi:hypothetical protein
MLRDSIKTTLEFFKRRFPEKDIELEIRCGYFGEWVERFESGTPELYMDDISKRAWEEIQLERQLKKKDKK